MEGMITTKEGKKIRTNNSLSGSVNPEKSRHSEFIRNIKNEPFRRGYDKIQWNSQKWDAQNMPKFCVSALGW